MEASGKARCLPVGMIMTPSRSSASLIAVKNSSSTLHCARQTATARSGAGRIGSEAAFVSNTDIGCISGEVCALVREAAGVVGAAARGLPAPAARTVRSSGSDTETPFPSVRGVRESRRAPSPFVASSGAASHETDWARLAEFAELSVHYRREDRGARADARGSGGAAEARAFGAGSSPRGMGRDHYDFATDTTLQLTEFRRSALRPDP